MIQPPLLWLFFGYLMAYVLFSWACMHVYCICMCMREKESARGGGPIQVGCIKKRLQGIAAWLIGETFTAKQSSQHIQTCVPHEHTLLCLVHPNLLLPVCLLVLCRIFIYFILFFQQQFMTHSVYCHNYKSQCPLRDKSFPALSVIDAPTHWHTL